MDHPMHDAPLSEAFRAPAQKALAVALGITALYMVVEIIGGFLTGSLALLADAGDMATDAVSLGISLFAGWYAQKPPSTKNTFGTRRVEVLAALANGLTLWAMVGVIAHEAYLRLHHPPDVQGGGMLAVAIGGLLANLSCAWVLRRVRGRNLNVRGAYLHVLMDVWGSVGVILAAVIILLTGWRLADPLISFFICALVLRSSWQIVRESLHILMEGAPERLDSRDIASALAGVDGVLGMHDLHIWTLGSGFESLTCHLIVRRHDEARGTLEAAQAMLRERFGLEHVTIQMEEQQLDTDGLRT